MSLENTYNKVSNTRISGLSRSQLPPIEKDPTIQKLEKDVFSRLAETFKKDNPTKQIEQNSTEVKFFSFEDAIKELHSMSKKDK